MLARAYLDGALGGDTPQAVEAALTSVLDDSSPLVRRALERGVGLDLCLVDELKASLAKLGEER